MAFQIKKLQIETLSEYLSSVRNNLNLSVKEVSDQTNIKSKFLQDLESGNFLQLPPDVYVIGFLNQLAKLYSIDAGLLVSQYKKEKGIQNQLAVIKPGSLRKDWQTKVSDRLVVTPKVLSLIFGLTFVGLTVAYIIWQVWSINKTPDLQISYPSEDAVIEGSAVEISGSTDPGMMVFINEQNVFVDSNGNFKTQLSLTPGPKEINITAKNRFGKTSSKILNITSYKPMPGISAAPTLEVRISFTSNVTLRFSVDDGVPQTVNFFADQNKILSASRKIMLSTTNAGSTFITVNGENLGPMGKPNEQLENVVFVPKAN